MEETLVSQKMSKIDLIKEDKIRLWNSFSESDEYKKVFNFAKVPGRYNFSQTLYNFKTEHLTKEKINLGISKKISYSKSK